MPSKKPLPHVQEAFVNEVKKNYEFRKTISVYLTKTNATYKGLIDTLREKEEELTLTNDEIAAEMEKPNQAIPPLDLMEEDTVEILNEIQPEQSGVSAPSSNTRSRVGIKHTYEHQMTTSAVGTGRIQPLMMRPSESMTQLESEARSILGTQRITDHDLQLVMQVLTFMKNSYGK